MRYMQSGWSGTLVLNSAKGIYSKFSGNTLAWLSWSLPPVFVFSCAMLKSSGKKHSWVLKSWIYKNNHWRAEGNPFKTFFPYGKEEEKKRVMDKLLELVIKCTLDHFPIFPVLILMVFSWHLCIFSLHTKDISKSHTLELSYYLATAS